MNASRGSTRVREGGRARVSAELVTAYYGERVDCEWGKGTYICTRSRGLLLMPLPILLEWSMMHRKLSDPSMPFQDQRRRS